MDLYSLIEHSHQTRKNRDSSIQIGGVSTHYYCYYVLLKSSRRCTADGFEEDEVAYLWEMHKCA